MGGNVLVPQGHDVGGDFKHIPACRSPSQFGCVVAYSTFDGPVPPNSLFGRSTNPADEVLCTDPAALAGGAAPLTAIFPSRALRAGDRRSAPRPTSSASRARTVRPRASARPDSYDSTCVDADGADVMQVSPLGGAPVLDAVPDAHWGLHLTDANIALGNDARPRAAPVPAYERKNAAK